MTKFVLSFCAICFCVSSAHGVDWNKVKEELQKQAEKNRQAQQKPAAQPAATNAAPAAPAAPPAPATSIICNSIQKINVCYAFTGAENAGKAAKGNEMACKMMRGRYMPSGECPVTGALGKCTVLAGRPKEYILYYYPGRFSKTSAQTDCTNPKSSIHAQGAGTWAALN